MNQSMDLSSSLFTGFGLHDLRFMELCSLRVHSVGLTSRVPTSGIVDLVVVVVWIYCIGLLGFCLRFSRNFGAVSLGFGA